MCIEKTNLDWHFNDKVKEVGYWYYVNDLVTNISVKNNVYSCDCGKYKTSIQFCGNKKEEIDELECSCSFYENEDNFCPHIYALVCYVFNVVKEDSKYNIKLLEKYKNNDVNKIKKDFDNGKIDLIDLDILGYKYEKLFPDRNSEVLLENLNKYIENIPIDILEKAKNDALLENEDTSILNNAIKKKSVHNKEREEKLKQKIIRNIFKAFISGLFIGDKLLKNEVYEKDYESYQFEEDELEEDDYYYDDDNEK